MAKPSKWLKFQYDADDGLPFIPLLEIFGGTLGVLLLFLFLMVQQQERIREQQKNPENIGGIVNMKLGEDMGYIISCFTDSLRIEETQTTVSLGELFIPNNPFITYCQDRFLQEKQKNQDKVICAFVYPGSNDVIMQVEKTLMAIGAEKYNFFVINEEIMDRLLKINEKNFGI